MIPIKIFLFVPELGESSFKNITNKCVIQVNKLKVLQFQQDITQE